MSLIFGEYFFFFVYVLLEELYNYWMKELLLINRFTICSFLARDRNTEIIYITRNQLIDPINDY